MLEKHNFIFQNFLSLFSERPLEELHLSRLSHLSLTSFLILEAAVEQTVFTNGSKNAQNKV